MIEPELIRESQRRRGASVEVVDEVIGAFHSREVEKLNSSEQKCTKTGSVRDLSLITRIKK